MSQGRKRKRISSRLMGTIVGGIFFYFAAVIMEKWAEAEWEFDGGIMVVTKVLIYVVLFNVALIVKFVTEGVSEHV